MPIKRGETDIPPTLEIISRAGAKRRKGAKENQKRGPRGQASVFRVNRPEPESGDGVTQFGRASDDLDIICALKTTDELLSLDFMDAIVMRLVR